MKAMQDKLDKLLPATVNLISVPYNGRFALGAGAPTRISCP
jgi:hypothetical protein